MSEIDDDKAFELELQDAEENEVTPADTREAINAAVFLSARYSRKAAWYSLKSYQMATRQEARLKAVEDDVAKIKRQGFTIPNVLATMAFLMAFAALLLVGSVITGRIDTPLPHRETAVKRR